MQTSQTDTLIDQGIAAFKGGDRNRARSLLTQAVRTNPQDERAWLWLSGTLDVPDQQCQCLQRVLKINPHNTTARRALEKISGSNASSPANASALPTPAPLTPAAAPPVSPAPPAPAAAESPIPLPSEFMGPGGQTEMPAPAPAADAAPQSPADAASPAPEPATGDAVLDYLIELGTRQGFIDLNDIINAVDDPMADPARIDAIGYALHAVGIEIRDGDEVINLDEEGESQTTPTPATSAIKPVTPINSGTPASATWQNCRCPPRPPYPKQRLTHRRWRISNLLCASFSLLRRAAKLWQIWQ